MSTKNKEALLNYCLRLGDANLVLSQRLSEWTGHGPILEEDLALTNIALDLLGQARAFLTYAGETEGKGKTEDELAFMRDEPDFKNPLISELPIGDFANTIVRQFLFSTYMHHLYSALQKSTDETIAGIAAKAFKETTYHVRHSTEWLLRLADGTEESRQRVINALEGIWMYTGDMFDNCAGYDTLIKDKIAADTLRVKGQWDKTVLDVFARVDIQVPHDSFMFTGSTSGRHTEHLGHLLSEMQYMQRAYPGAKW